MNNISEILRSLIDRFSSIDIVESEFMRMLNDDDELKTDYKEWCDDLGYLPKAGYKEFIEEIIENQDSIWDVLDEYDENN